MAAMCASTALENSRVFFVISSHLEIGQVPFARVRKITKVITQTCHNFLFERTLQNYSLGNLNNNIKDQPPILETG